MISDSNKWQRLARLKYRGYTLIDITTSVLVLFTMGCLSYSLVYTLKKKARFSVSDPITGLPVKGSVNSGPSSSDWTLSSQTETEGFVDNVLSVPVSLNPIEPEIAYRGKPKDLNQPTLSHLPGSYLGSRFPIDLNISNPNNASTWIMLSVNGARFDKHLGGSIRINSGDRIEAYVRGDTREWNESVSISATYTSKSSGIMRPGLIPVQRIKMQR